MEPLQITDLKLLLLTVYQEEEKLRAAQAQLLARKTQIQQALKQLEAAVPTQE